MNEYSNFDKLKMLFKQYIDITVVENDVPKEVLFHSLLGIMLTVKGYKFVISGKKKTLRIHTFMLQPSGTGKSEIMSSLHELIKYLCIPCRKTLKDNESACTGSVVIDRKNQITVCPGYMKDLYAYLWDEGSILIKSGSFMENMTDVWQSAMDEPGWVSKGMRHGSVEYDTNVTLVTGSYEFEEFQRTLLERGFLQRMFVVRQMMTSIDKQRMQNKVVMLAKRSNDDRLSQLKHAFKVLYDNIPPATESTEKIIFDGKAVDKFVKKWIKINDTFIRDQFDGLKGDVLNTFFNRSSLHVEKIAAQRAFVEKRNVVNYDDLLYGMNMVKIHIESIVSLFNEFGQIGGQSENRRRLSMIKAIITSNGGCMEYERLLDRLHDQLMQGRWDLQRKGTTLFIDRIEREKQVTYSTDANGIKLVLI